MGNGRFSWFDLHSWVGLKLSVFMAFICITGTLAVFSHEIDWLLNSEMRVTPRDTQASWGKMVAAVQAAYPQWRLNYLSAPHARRFAAMAAMQTPEGRNRFVWVDPYTARVTGDTPWFNVHRFLRNTHRHLMMPVQIGVPLVSALALALLLSLFSSFFIYKRWWRGFFAWPRPQRRRRLWGDTHRLLGIWGLWFILLIALTGTWYLVESLGGEAPSTASIRPTQEGGARPADPYAIDRAIAEAQQRWPQLRISTVRPSPGGGSLLLEGEAQAWLVRDRANVAGFDLRTGGLLGLRDGRDLNAHQRISEMADPLHFGSFGGWPIRVIWLVFGAALSGLSITGVYLYGLRTTDALRAALRRGAIR